MTANDIFESRSRVAYLDFDFTGAQKQRAIRTRKSHRQQSTAWPWKLPQTGMTHGVQGFWFGRQTRGEARSESMG